MWEARRDVRKKLQRNIGKLEDDGYIHSIVVMVSKGGYVCQNLSDYVI